MRYPERFESGAPAEVCVGAAVSFSPGPVSEGSERTSSTPSPAWQAARSKTATGTGGEGGTGSRGAPHPAARRMTKIEIRKTKIENPRDFLVRRWAASEF